MSHRQGLHSDDRPYPGEPLCYCDEDKPSTPTSTDTKIDDLLDRNFDWCDDCEHPICLDKKKSFTTALKTLLTSEKNKANGCPCLLVEPCSYACTCANIVMSGGCMRCCKYGSKEQRLKSADRLAELKEEQ